MWEKTVTPSSRKIININHIRQFSYLFLSQKKKNINEYRRT